MSTVDLNRLPGLIHALLFSPCCVHVSKSNSASFESRTNTLALSRRIRRASTARASSTPTAGATTATSVKNGSALYAAASRPPARPEPPALGTRARARCVILLRCSIIMLASPVFVEASLSFADCLSCQVGVQVVGASQLTFRWGQYDMGPSSAGRLIFRWGQCDMDPSSAGQLIFRWGQVRPLRRQRRGHSHRLQGPM